MPTVYIEEGFCICLQYILMKGFVYAYSIY